MNPIIWSKADVDSFNLKKTLFYHPRIKGGYPGICSDLSLEVKGSQVLISTFFFFNHEYNNKISGQIAFT